MTWWIIWIIQLIISMVVLNYLHKTIGFEATVILGIAMIHSDTWVLRKVYHVTEEIEKRL